MGTIARSAQVQQQIENAEAVLASGDTHRDVIARGASIKLPGHTPEQVAAFIDGNLAYLRASTRALDAAEEAYVRERADDVPLRDARDAATVDLLELHVSVRDRIEDVFGPRALVLYGLDGTTPREPKALATHVTSAVNLLNTEPNEGRDSMGGALTTAAVAEALSTKLLPLATHLDALVREDRENEAALTLRDRATDEWRHAYRSVATLLSGLYLLAGREDLAERIRPTARREAGVEATPPEPSEPSPPVA